LEGANWKMQNGGSSIEKISNKISERLLDLGVEVVSLSNVLIKHPIGKIIAKQLLRSGTAAGANYEETCGAESRADFIHKMQIVYKELKETRYWFRLIKRSKIIEFSNLDGIINETNQLCSIIAKSVITAKNNQKI
jgi:four helix bundle protein